MESNEIIEAMQNKSPVIYDGSIYKQILEYILWFDKEGNKQRSVVLLDKNEHSTIRVRSSMIQLA